MPLTPEWMVSLGIPWRQEMMEEPNEYLLNELIVKYESTLKYISQNHGQMERHLIALNVCPGIPAGWPAS